MDENKKYQFNYKENGELINKLIDKVKLTESNKAYKELYQKLSHFALFVLKTDYRKKLPSYIHFNKIADHFSNYIIMRVFMKKLPEIKSWYSYIRIAIKKSINEEMKFLKNNEVSFNDLTPTSDMNEKVVDKEGFKDLLSNKIKNYKNKKVLPLLITKLRFPDISLSLIDEKLVRINAELSELYKLGLDRKKIDQILKFFTKNNAPEMLWYLALRYLIHEKELSSFYLIPLLASPNLFSEVLKLGENKLTKRIIETARKIYYYQLKYIKNQKIIGNEDFSKRDIEKWDKEKNNFFFFLLSLENEKELDIKIPFKHEIKFDIEVVKKILKLDKKNDFVVDMIKENVDDLSLKNLSFLRDYLNDYINQKFAS